MPHRVSPKVPLLLIILDGWGLREEREGNAIRLASTPIYDGLLRDYPTTSLKASGEVVGLPQGQMGNSEVGHLNLGAGRVVYQEYSRINRALADASFFSNETLKEVFLEAKERGRRLHFIGLLSDGGVHSHLSHLFGLLEMAASYHLQEVFVHAIMDGRDTDPMVGEKYINQLKEKLLELRVGEISTISGRYYSMDRDNRWDRIRRAYDAMVLGKGHEASSPLEALQMARDRGEGDEFIEPTVLGDGSLEEGDLAFFFNFRADRIRQLSQVLAFPDFLPFPSWDPPLIQAVTLTQYNKSYPFPVIFPPLILENTLATLLSKAGLKQLHTAETEKYAHVTFFFNGGKEDPVQGEERHLVPSPQVATYDLKPEMSAEELTNYVLKELDLYDFIVMNYANPDMVGHTGILEAGIRAITFVDTQLGRILDAMEKIGGEVFITSDHGNAEQMIGEGGGAHTAHTSNPVPFIYFGPRLRKLEEGILADVAPTLLDCLGIAKPPEMTGRSLLKEVKE